jgi:peptidoglycan/LPS O-acetylase OafA/YrhL
MTPAMTKASPATAKESPKHWLDSWHVSPSVNRDYDFIDGLRGIAILMVVACHHFYINPNSGRIAHWAEAIIGTGVHGVTLFFALSGFLISWPFWKRKFSGSDKVMPRGYFQRRFWKIYPPLVLSVLILTPIYILTQSDWTYLLLGLKWLVGWGFIVPVSGKFNPVVWTLVVEVQFYLVLPLLFLCLRRVPARACLAILSSLFILVPFIVRLITGYQTASLVPKIDPHFPALMDAFAFGVLVAGLENMGVIKAAWVHGGVAGIILWPLVLLCMGWFNMHADEYTFAVKEILTFGVRFAAACLLLFVAQPQHPVAKLLSAPWLRWFGIISYEWYLFHQPLARWSAIYLGPAAGNPIKYAVILGLPLVGSLIISATIFRFFSLPLLRYGRDKNKA